LLNLSNNLFFDVEIGDSKNFLAHDDLMFFRIKEISGALLPSVDLTIRTFDLRVKDKFLQNNALTIKIGEGINNIDTFEVSIMESPTVQESSGSSSFIISISGCLFNKRFLTDKVHKIKSGTSLDVIKSVQEKYFKTFTSDITQVNETVGKWSQNSDTDANLMAEAWLHQNIKPSFPLLAVTKYGEVLLKDFDKLKKSTPKYTFVQKAEATTSTEIAFLNIFTPTNDTIYYNLHNGYGRVANIVNKDTGEYSLFANEYESTLSATRDIEVADGGTKVLEGYQNTNNTHKTFYETYFYNTSKIIQLSNIRGELKYSGLYKRDLKVLDLITVELGESEKYNTISGRYIISGICMEVVLGGPLTTTLTVCRDSHNNLENNITNPIKYQRINQQRKENVLNTLRKTRRTTSLLRLFYQDGFSETISQYVSDVKDRVLNSMSINGYSMNYLTQQGISGSLIATGRSIMRGILERSLPPNIYLLVQSIDFTKGVRQNNFLTNLIFQHIPNGYTAGDVSELLYLLGDILQDLSAIKESIDTKILEEARLNSIGGTTSVDAIILTDFTSAIQVDNIVNDLLSNVNGLDIPIPIIQLTEAETLYDDIKLKDFVADSIMNSLSDKGYLTDINNFRDILLGNTTLDFNTINKINENIGNSLSIRHWGSFTDLTELTDYFVKFSYKDKYRTVNCIKTISAKGGKKLFFALPASEDNLTFYINNNLTPLDNTTITLNYYNSLGTNIPYNIYYTTEQYNSNSVLFEVRRGN